MKKSQYIIQMILAPLVILVLSLVLDRSLELVLSYKAFIIMLFYWAIPCLFVYGFESVKKNFRVAFNNQATETEMRQSIRFFNGMISYSILSSLVISIFVICYYLGNLDDTLGRFLEISLITPAYSIFFSLLLMMPLKMSLENSLQ